MIMFDPLKDIHSFILIPLLEVYQEWDVLHVGHLGFQNRDLEDKRPKIYQRGHQSNPESPQKYFRLVP